MTPEDFVRAITRVVVRGGADGVLRQLNHPAGRAPDSALVAASEWFASLKNEDRVMVSKVLVMAADQAAYNFLLVLDGLLAIEDMVPKGRLELLHISDSQRSLLNSDESSLSALYKDSLQQNSRG